MNSRLHSLYLDASFLSSNFPFLGWVWTHEINLCKVKLMTRRVYMALFEDSYDVLYLEARDKFLGKSGTSFDLLPLYLFNNTLGKFVCWLFCAFIYIVLRGSMYIVVLPYINHHSIMTSIGSDNSTLLRGNMFLSTRCNLWHGPFLE